MMPRRIAGATHRLEPPKGWGDTCERSCAALSIRVDGDVYLSAWEPTPDEIAMLVAGGSVVLRVLGGQPPVVLSVEPSVDDAG